MTILSLMVEHPPPTMKWTCNSTDNWPHGLLRRGSPANFFSWSCVCVCARLCFRIVYRRHFWAWKSRRLWLGVGLQAAYQADMFNKQVWVRRSLTWCSEVTHHRLNGCSITFSPVSLCIACLFIYVCVRVWRCVPVLKVISSESCSFPECVEG